MAPSSSELWSHQLMPSTVLVDCLLPNGILIQLPCSREATLGQIKTQLWKEARKYPLYGKLLSPELYIFISITQDAEKEEFYDEARRFCDLRLFQPTLRLVEPEGNKEEKMLNYEIGMAIGISVNEFNDNSDPEVRSFRRDILAICESSIKERDKHGPKSLALYYYPPDIDADPKLPQHIDNKLKETDYSVIFCVWIMEDVQQKQGITIKIKHSDKPEDVVSETIRKKTRAMPDWTPKMQKQIVSEHQDSYLLKVCGTRQFLIGSYPLYQYRYVRSCIIQSRVPQLLLIKKSDFENDLPKTTFLQPSFLRGGVSKTRPEVSPPSDETLSLWEVKIPFRVKVNSATFVNVREVGRIFVKTGIFLGTEQLCMTQDTRQVDSSNPLWNEWLEFDIEMSDLPRCARLCIAMCCSTAKRRRDIYTLAWGNINLFDFKNKLMSGKMSLNLWPVPQGLDDLLNPIGCPIANPNTDSPCLEIEFLDFGTSVLSPSQDMFIQLAKQPEPESHYEELPDALINHEDEIRTLQDIVKRDVLAEISEQEKEILWRRRVECLKTPDSLPKLLKAVKWNKREDVAQLYMLLEVWPQLSDSAALELLDCTYLDLAVREFSVTSLEQTLSADKLSQYLLQLVQSLKVEPYLNNALTRFLLARALGNKKIGHFFFWHLKSEIHHVNIKLRFSLILEAYCRGCGPFLKEVNRQVESLEKLTKITELLKNSEDDRKLKAFREYVEQPDIMDALRNYTSPLDCAVMLGQLDAAESRVMHSKKSPLSLCWRNPDPSVECLGTGTELSTHRIIFKNGDDLRQDMLTLQVISIMERIWQSEGLDLRMMPYGCLSTGKEVGMIEEVRKCKTVMQIQKMSTAGGMQWDNTRLNKWLKHHNKGDLFDCARETFVKSCAGYCVATFVLGIGDRHPDNIMLTKDGHVFHIDFGHFLDHRKKKLGIQRERVPFVLTDDFICVIGGEKNPKKSQGFTDFMELCGTAYLKLRQHANIFITLFSMMMGCGIPELQSMDDIGYLRKTLAVDKTETEAVKYFQEQFHDAYGGAWSTKIDWFAHWLAHR